MPFRGGNGGVPLQFSSFKCSFLSFLFPYVFYIPSIFLLKFFNHFLCIFQILFSFLSV